MPLSINSYISQIVAGQGRKPGPIHDALQAVANWAAAGLVDADIAAGAAIAISKTAIGTYTPPTNWTPGHTGFSVNPTVLFAQYMQVGKLMTVIYIVNAYGTSNATTFTITGLPGAPSLGTGQFTLQGQFIKDNGSFASTGRIDILDASTTMTLYTTFGGGAWTNSGAKGIANFILQFPVP